LAQVGLSGVEDLLPSQLSGGMRKRASVARALAMDPEVLIFDEPSAGLDPIIAAGIDELIVDLKQAFKMTIVIVTHEMHSAFLIADRMCMLHKGKIVAVGTKEEIQQSANERVRQFLDRRADEPDDENPHFVTGL
jgi:phospholipid/cholesterol/gamma-HCH transport system ATP-binding protein